MTRSGLGTQTISRRGLVRGSVVVLGGLGAAALLGCGAKGAPSAGRAPEAPGAPAVAANTPPKRPYPFTIPASNATPKKGGRAVVQTASDLGTFDASKTGATGNLSPAGAVYETLLRRKMTTKEVELGGSSPSKDIEGHLAQSYEVTPDGLTYTFKLRPNIKWQNIAPLNGRAFVAEDVKKSYERYAKTGIWQGNFSEVDAWTAVDATTLKVKLKRPSADFIVPLAEQNNPIQPMELVDNNSLDKVAIGTGPMIFKEAV